jgi:hypothetical protein
VTPPTTGLVVSTICFARPGGEGRKVEPPEQRKAAPAVPEGHSTSNSAMMTRTIDMLMNPTKT